MKKIAKIRRQAYDIAKELKSSDELAEWNPEAKKIAEKLANDLNKDVLKTFEVGFDVDKYVDANKVASQIYNSTGIKLSKPEVYADTRLNTFIFKGQAQGKNDLDLYTRLDKFLGNQGLRKRLNVE